MTVFENSTENNCRCEKGADRPLRTYEYANPGTLAFNSTVVVELVL